MMTNLAKNFNVKLCRLTRRTISFNGHTCDLSLSTLHPLYYIILTGIHALAAVIFNETGDNSQSSRQISLLLQYLKSALDSSAADEILYGRAGYLFSLLFVKNHVSKDLLEGVEIDLAMRKVFDEILGSGKKHLGSAQR